MSVKAVEIRAEIRQIKTMADYTANIILNIPEDCREQIKVMLDWIGDEITLMMANDHLDSEEIDDGGKRRGRQTKKG